MKIPMALINRDTVTLYLELCNAFKHLRKGFKGLCLCIVFGVPCILLTILDLILEMFKKNRRIRFENKSH